MNMRESSCVLSVLMAVGCTGPPIAFEEGTLAIEDAAHVEGVVDESAFSTIRVRIEEIDGDLEIWDWNDSSRYVLLAPGEYAITVSYSSMIKQPGMVWMAINAEDANRHDYTRRNLRLSVEGGFTYHIHFSDLPVRCLVNRVRTSDHKDRPSWVAPWGAVECLSAGGVSNSEPLICSFSGADVR